MKIPRLIKQVSFVLMVFSVWGLVGCAKKQVSSNAELRMWVMPNTPKSQQDMEEILAPFLAQNPDIKVNVTVLDWGSAWQKLTTGAIAGDIADVIQIGSSWGASLTDMGALMPMDSLAQSIGMQNFHPATIENSKPLTSKSITSLPWFLDIRPVYYRTDVFEKAGIDPNSINTWEHFTGALTKISKAGMVSDGQTIAAIGVPGKNDWNVVHNFASWIWSAGGDFLNETGDSCVINSDKALKGVLAYLNIVKSGLAPKNLLEKNSAQVSAEFDAGRIAVLIEPTPKYVFLNLPPEQGGLSNTHVARNYHFLVPPEGPEGRRIFLGGSQIAVSKFTKHPKQAMEVVKYLAADSTAQLEFAKRSGWLPSLNTALNTPYFTDDSKRKVLVEAVKYGKIFRAVPYWAEIETAILVRHFGNIFDIVAEVNGPYSEDAVRKELDATASEVNALIKSHFKNNPEDREALKAAVANQLTRTDSK